MMSAYDEHEPAEQVAMRAVDIVGELTATALYTGLSVADEVCNA